VFLGLLDGGLAGMGDDAIIAVLLKAAAEAAHGEEDDYDDQLSDEAFPEPGGDERREDRVSEGTLPEPDHHEGRSGRPSDEALSQPDGDESRDDLPSGCSYGHGEQHTCTEVSAPAAPAEGPGDAGGHHQVRASPGACAAGEVRVRVTTLFHLDDFPGELAGWGPIHAHLARRLVKRQVSGEWRFAVCDEDGHLLYAGITGHRPGGWPRGPAGRSKPGSRPGEASVRRAGGNGIVELQIPLSLLRRWQADLPALGAWAWVIADIARQLETARVPEKDHDPRRRFARAGLRRWIQIRDRVCTAPGCRAPASRSELDHISPHGHGGVTTARNLEAACAHDHDLRDHGWRVVRLSSDEVVWISRTGHRYPVRSAPIIEALPEQISGPGVSMSERDLERDLEPSCPASWEDTPAWWEPSPSGAGPAREVGSNRADQEQLHDPADDIPPF
jgi:hypothetical protein